MTDETPINGVSSYADADSNFEIPVQEPDEEPKNDLVQKIAALEQENAHLSQENQIMIVEINKLNTEIESDKQSLNSISARALDLETESENSSAEIAKLNNSLDGAAKERESLLSKLDILVNENAKAEDEIIRLKNLESEVTAMKSEMENLRTEKEGLKVAKNDDEIIRVKKLQSEITELKSEMENLKKDKEGLEVAKNGFEDLLKKSERKSKILGAKIDELQKCLEDSSEEIVELKEKAAKAASVLVEDEAKGKGMKMKVEWPLVAASAGAVAVVALVYLRFVRER